MHMGDTIGGYNFYAEGYPERDGALEHPRLIEQGNVTSDIFLNEKVKVLEMNSKIRLIPSICCLQYLPHDAPIK